MPRLHDLVLDQIKDWTACLGLSCAAADESKARNSHFFFLSTK